MLQSTEKIWITTLADIYQILMMASSNGTFPALLALCEGNSPVIGEFPSQRPVTRSFDVFFNPRLYDDDDDDGDDDDDDDGGMNTTAGSSTEHSSTDCIVAIHVMCVKLIVCCQNSQIYIVGYQYTRLCLSVHIYVSVCLLSNRAFYSSPLYKSS